jgi:hypothetical protein
VFFAKAEKNMNQQTVQKTLPGRQKVWKPKGWSAASKNCGPTSGMTRICLGSYQTTIPQYKPGLDGWPHAGAIDAGLIVKWPTCINKNRKETKKKCTGALPLEHPSISNLADKNHRIHGYGSKMFELAVAAKPKDAYDDKA